MKFGAEAFFHRQKKNLIRGCTGRKRPEQEWISETNCPADADRQVGLLFQIIPAFISWATGDVEEFLKGFAASLDSLSGEERNELYLFFIFVFSVVLLDS